MLSFFLSHSFFSLSLAQFPSFFLIPSFIILLHLSLSLSLFLCLSLFVLPPLFHYVFSLSPLSFNLVIYALTLLLLWPSTLLFIPFFNFLSFHFSFFFSSRFLIISFFLWWQTLNQTTNYQSFHVFYTPILWFPFSNQRNNQRVKMCATFLALKITLKQSKNQVFSWWLIS